MKRILTIVVAVSIALSMTACDALDKILQTNLFGAVGGVSGAEIARATTTELVELGKSESFYATLAGDAKTKEEVVRKVEDALAAADKPAEKQELAILAADIQLKTSGGDVVVNNITDVLMNQDAIKDASGNIDPAKLLKEIMPAGVVDASGTVTDEAAFKAIIDGLAKADGYYDQLGASIGTTGYADDTVNAGAIAQSAIVAATIASLTPPPGKTSGDYLLDLIKGTDTPPATFEFPAMTAGTPLGNLLAAAQFDPTTFGL